MEKQKKKADRMAKSRAARVRRRTLKDTVWDVTTRMYARLRKQRKSK
jgi:hypothetical protein